MALAVELNLFFLLTEYLDIQINYIYLILRRTKIFSWLDKLQICLSKFHGFNDLFSVFKDMNTEEDITKHQKTKKIVYMYNLDLPFSLSSCTPRYC